MHLADHSVKLDSKLLLFHVLDLLHVTSSFLNVLHYGSRAITISRFCIVILEPFKVIENFNFKNKLLKGCQNYCQVSVEGRVGSTSE